MLNESVTRQRGGGGILMKALKRSRVLEQVIAGQLTNAEAAEALGLSRRQ